MRNFRYGLLTQIIEFGNPTLGRNEAILCEKHNTLTEKSKAFSF